MQGRLKPNHTSGTRPPSGTLHRKPQRRGRGMARGFAAFLLLFGLVLGAQFTLFDAAHATIVVDQDGPNDEPGQKDLNSLEIGTATATDLNILWSWDEIASSGNNSYDACALFDTDADGDANFALCEVVNGDPAIEVNTVLYTCSDLRPDRCTGPTEDLSFGSTCTVAVVDSDPFDGPAAKDTGSEWPDDLVATCNIVLADVTGAGAGTTLLNVCSYPSQEPNSDPSDCVLVPEPPTSLVTIIKEVVNDNGGTATAADFNIHVKSGGIDVTGSPAAGSATGTAYDLLAGTYVVSEDTPPAGYTQTGIVCDGLATDTVVVAADGEPHTCTITNNDNAPSLTLVKTVTNDNGGTAVAADWTLTATGYDAASPDAGTYNLSESGGPAGYTQTSLTCSNSAGQVTSVTLGLGENVTCTFVNDDIAPKLTVTKTVVNDNGGTLVIANFPLFIDATGVTSGVQNTTTIGAHTVSETNQPGYAASAWGGDCAANGSITLAIGDVKACTITNNDTAGSIRHRAPVTPPPFPPRPSQRERGSGGKGPPAKPAIAARHAPLFPPRPSQWERGPGGEGPPAKRAIATRHAPPFPLALRRGGVDPV